MANLYFISEWEEQQWWSTGGTRNKKIYLNPEDGELYYFKQSLQKQGRDYRYEFWSEIIASEIGEMIGFNMLKYDIAVVDDVVGCVSKTMIHPENEELIEGGKILQSFDKDFIPGATKNSYDFQLIDKTFEFFDRSDDFDKIIEIIVFDTLIGNSDRHQENWAFISSISEVRKNLDSITESKNDERLPFLLRKIIQLFFTKDTNKIKPSIERYLIQNQLIISGEKARFAPIYDSGCSFGRELTDEKVSIFLKDEIQLMSYINRGKPEIHWQKKKISHFELLENLILDVKYKEKMLASIDSVVSRFNEAKIQEIIFSIDKELDGHSLNSHLLPNERKELILKLVTLRYQRLKEIYKKHHG